MIYSVKLLSILYLVQMNKLLQHLILFVLLPVVAYSQEKDSTVPKTFLWEISGNGLTTPSYLYGTTHLICESDIEMPDILKQKITRAKEVYLETAPANRADSSSKLYFLHKDTTLKDLIGRKYFRRVRNILEEKKPIKEETLQRLKPFHVGRLLDIASLKCRAISYESAIIKIAKAENIHINGLENAKEHSDVVDNIPLPVQANNLILQLDNLEPRIKNMETYMELYKQKELSQLYYKAVGYPNTNSKFKTNFLDNRNIAWVPNIIGIIQTGPAFFAFGCAHLLGDKGVINLLKEKGYTVSPVFYE